MDLLQYIRCPKCEKPSLTASSNFYTCPVCDAKYPVKDKILILVGPAHQEKIWKLWNKKEEFNGFEFLTTPKIAELARSYINDSTVTLDVGCGVGAYQKDFKGSVISFDYIPYFIKQAQKNFLRTNRIFILADATEFPFQSNVFDLVFCSQVIEHFEPKASEKVLQHMIRTTKKNILIDTPNDGNKFIHSLRNFLYPEVPNQINGKVTDTRMQHHKLMGRKDLEKYGFEVHSCIGYITRNRFRLGIFWDFYDLLGWYNADIGGNLIGVYRKS